MKRPDDGALWISAGKLARGGVQTHLHLLCRALRAAKREVTLFATGCEWPAGQIEELRTAGVRLALPPAFLLRVPRLAAAFALASWRGARTPAARCVYGLGAGRSHEYLRRLAGRGTVSIYHEIVTPPAVASQAGACVESSDAVVANSRAVADLMQQWWPQKPIRVIPFLVTDRALPAPSRARPAEELRVVYLGRLIAHKRPDQLVREWTAIAAHPPLAPARLDIYGYDPEGRMLGALRDFVRDRGLEKIITLHGAYDTAALPTILASADVVVLPSEWEGLPLVLVEAMLRGVPIVATAAGGTAEFADGNPDVIVTEVGWESFVEGLKTMAGKMRAGTIDPARLQAWTERRYGHETVARQWLECLTAPRAFFGV